jgi:hypothetical protein
MKNVCGAAASSNADPGSSLELAWGSLIIKTTMDAVPIMSISRHGKVTCLTHLPLLYKVNYTNGG